MRYIVSILFSSHVMIHMVITLIHSQIEPYQGNGDDTAVNVIRLLCKQAWDGFPEVSSVTSATMRWGEEQPKLYCPDDYWIVAFRVSNMIHDCLTMLILQYGLVIFIIVTMPFHNTQYIMGYNIMAQPHGLTMSL